MKMKKTVLLLAIVAAVLLLAVACSTSSFSQEGSTTDLAVREYKELGKFTYSSGKVGYTDILAAAKAVYPECDEVIDIYTETVDSTILFIFHVRTINVYATAIKWLDAEPGKFEHRLQ